MQDKRLIIITIATVLCAGVVSECIYWYLMVPRLPQYQSAPFFWWITVLSPFGLASLIIGFLIKTGRFIPLHGVIASLAAIVGRMLFLLATGRQPPHDALWEDMLEPAELIGLVPWILIVSLVFSVAMCAGYVIRIVVQRAKMRKPA